MATNNSLNNECLNDFTVTRSNSGGNVNLEVTNTSNTASSDATVEISTGGTSGGDSKVLWTDGTNNWTTGIPAGTSGAFYVAPASTLGTPTFTMTPTGVAQFTAEGLTSGGSSIPAFTCLSKFDVFPVVPAPYNPNFFFGQINGNADVSLVLYNAYGMPSNNSSISLVFLSVGAGGPASPSVYGSIRCLPQDAGATTSDMIFSVFNSGAGTFEAMRLQNTGLVSIPDKLTVGASTLGSVSDNLSVIANTSGHAQITMRNGDTTTGDASIVSVVQNGTTGPAFFGAQVNGAAQHWTWGLSTATSNAFLLCFDLNLAANTYFQVETTGEVRMPLQPAFLAYLASTVNNKTGNGASYQLGTDALTEVFDQGGNFNTNGTFTAPVTGKYQLSAAVSVSGCTVATSITLSIVTSNRTYQQTYNRTASADNMALNLTSLCDMDAADTAVVTVVCAGEVGDTDDIVGSATLVTFFSGSLAC